MPKKILDEISKKPRFFHLPEPINIESGGKSKNIMKYKSFNELKYKQTQQKYRPNYVHNTKSDSAFSKGKISMIPLYLIVQNLKVQKLPNSL